MPALFIRAGAAENGVCGEGVNWTLDGEGVLTLSGSGTMYNDYTEPGGAKPSPFAKRADIKKVVAGDGISYIGNFAFYGCSEITSVSLSNGVESIGDHAFHGCSGMTAVTLPYSLDVIGSRAFLGCSSLEEITFPYSLTDIGEHAFRACSALKAVTFCENTASIASYAFYATDIKDVYYLGSASDWELIDIALNNTVFESASFHYSKGQCGAALTYELSSDGRLTVKGSGAMTDYAALSEYPYSASPFAGDGRIKQLVIEKGVSAVGSNAFRSCEKLEAASLPDGLKNIKASAFKGCSGLKGIAVPNGVTDIGDCAFEHCSSLKSATVPGSVSGVNGLGSSVFASCSVLKTVTVGEGVARIGASMFKDCSSLVSLDIPESVTLISQEAFYGCTALSEAVLPENLTEIGKSAYNSCSSLKKLNLHDKISYICSDAFYGCDALKNVFYGGFKADWEKINIEGGNEALNGARLVSYDIGEKLTWSLSDDGTLTISGSGEMSDFSAMDLYPFSASPFAGNEKIKKLVVESGVTGIGDGAFGNCSNLENADLAGSVKRIGERAFQGCGVLKEFDIPEGATEIGDFTFAQCYELKKATIPSTVTRIGKDAFCECYELENIKLPEKITEIGERAFGLCYKLTEAEIPEGVTQISDYLFSNCSGLKRVKLPGSVARIGVYAFYFCPALEEISIPEKVTELKTGVFSGCSSLTAAPLNGNINSIGDSAFAYCEGITGIDVPDSVAYIGDGAFYGCKSLKNAALPNSVAQISDYAFEDCESLETAVIPSGVTQINEGLFSGCKSMKSVVIPKKVTLIKDSAFYGCDSLKDVYYGGGQTDWDNDVSVEYNNDPLLDADFRFGQVFITVSYNANGGVNAPKPQSALNSVTLSFDKPEKTLVITLNAAGGIVGVPSVSRNAVFTGWNTKADGTGEAFAPGDVLTASQNATLYAQWGAATAGELPAAAREGYTFLGWFTSAGGGEAVKPDYSFTENATVYAQYKANHHHDYSLKYDASFHWYECSCGDIKDKQAHSFGEWVTDKEPTADEKGEKHTVCTGCSYVKKEEIPASGSPIPPEELKFIVTYKANGGKNAPAPQTAEGSLTLSSDKPERSLVITLNAAGGTVSSATISRGTVFTGWNTKADGTGKAYAPGDVLNSTKDVTLYAQWGAAAAGELPAAAREGYTFLGWFTSADAGDAVKADYVFTKNATLYARYKEGHTHDYSLKKDGSFHWYECSCGDIKDKQAHSFGAWVTDKAPTAEKEGKKHTVCSVCAYIKYATVPATGKTDPGKTSDPGKQSGTKNAFAMGDPDNDGKITAADARIALRRAVNLESFDENSPEFIACDVDHSHTVTAADARLILRAAVNLEDASKW